MKNVVKSVKSLKKKLFLISTLLITILLTLLVYSRGLKSPFLFDDVLIVFRSHAISHLWDFYSIFSYNRPLTRFTYALNYSLGGINPYGYHLFNILLHSCNTYLIGIFIFKLLSIFGEGTQKKVSIAIPSIMGALMYALNPALSMSVILISARSVLLCTFFYLIGIIYFLKYLEKRSMFLWAVICFAYLGAIASKEIAITFPIACILLNYLYNTRHEKASIWHAKLYFVLAVESIGLLIKFFTFNYGPTVNSGDLGFTRWEYFLTQITAWIKYTTIFFYPLPKRLCVDWDYPIVHSIFNLSLIVSMFILILVAIGLWFAWKKGWQEVCFAILLYFILLSPTSSIIPIADLFMEYRLYLPAVALTLLIIALFMKMQAYIKKNSIISVLILFVAITLIGNEFLFLQKRLKVYASAKSLWLDTVQKSPHKVRPHYNLAHTYFIVGKWKEAIDECEKALAIEKDNTTVLTLLGDIYREENNFEKAFNFYTKVLKLKPKDFAVVNKICYILLENNKPAQAWKYLSKFTEKMKTDDYYLNLAIYFTKKGQLKRAIAIYQQLIEMNATNVVALTNLGALYQQIGNSKESESCYIKAVQINPDYYLAHYGYGVLLLSIHRLDDALTHFTTAKDLNPAFPWTYYAMGNFFATIRNYNTAEAYYRKFLKLKPCFAKAWHRLGLVLNELGKKEEAKKAFEKEKKLDSK